MITRKSITRGSTVLLLLILLLGTVRPLHLAQAAGSAQEGTEGWGTFSLPAPVILHMDPPPAEVGPQSGEPRSLETLSAEVPAARSPLSSPADLTVFYNQVVGGTQTKLSPNSPTAANDGPNILSAFNMGGSRSVNYGSSWSDYDIWPAYIADQEANNPNFDGQHAGRSGDQEVLYDPSRGLAFWLIHFEPDANGNNLQLARTDDLSGSTWAVTQILPDGFCTGGPGSVGDFFERPRMALSSNYLYILSDVYRKPGDSDHCSVIVRLSLDDLVTGIINLGTFFYSSAHFGFGAADGATDTMYWAARAEGDTNTLRIYRWPESSLLPSGITSYDVDHTSYTTGVTYDCTVFGTGINPCAALDDRITAGWLRTDLDELGFMWTAPQDGSHAFPHVRTLVLDTSALPLTLAQDVTTSDADKALFLPSAGVNARGHVGGTFASAGGTAAAVYPQCSVWLYDNITGSTFGLSHSQEVTSGDGVPAANDWGRYFSTRKNALNQNQWLGTCYAMESGSPAPRVLRFGRLGDAIAIAGNAEVAGAVMNYVDGSPKTAVADGSGNYLIGVSSGWSGTVTPALPHYFFNPPSRDYVNITSDQGNQDYEALLTVHFTPDDGATVCRTPYIIVKIFLSELTRNASGAFNQSTVTFTLDGGNILNLASIRVPQTAPNIWAYIMYLPPTDLSLGPHTAEFTHPEASGTVTDTWTFTADNIACAPPTLLSALANEQTVELQQAPASLVTGDASRQSLISPVGSSGASNPDAQQAEIEADSTAPQRRERNPERPERSVVQGNSLPVAPGSVQSLQPAPPVILPAFRELGVAWTGWTAELARPFLVYLKPR